MVIKTNILMKNPLVLCFFLLSLFCFSQTKQEIRKQKKDKAKTAITQRKKLCDSLVWHNNIDVKLKKKDFVYTKEQKFRVYNSNKDFTVLQLGKRRGEPTPFLFIKVFSYNACIKKDDVLEILFSDSSKLQIKNNFPVNCEGNIVAELTNKQVEIIKSKAIKSMMVYTFENDFELHFLRKQAMQFNENLGCLQFYKI